MAPRIRATSSPAPQGPLPWAGALATPGMLCCRERREWDEQEETPTTSGQARVHQYTIKAALGC